MFNKIMIATDGSENAHDAIQYAAKLAKMGHAKEVVVIHVCPGCTADIDVTDTNREAAEDIVAEAGKVFADLGISARTKVEIDYPPEAIGSAIVDVAIQEDPDLIVLGSRGLSEFKGLLLGSVSNKVVQKAHCPVLVVKHEQPEDR
jgi:nucleotide-binding universal stress UspA family protein